MKSLLVLFSALALASGSVWGQGTATAQAGKPPTAASTDDVYEAGKALWDRYVPEEVKRDYEYPSKKQWDEFGAKLERALKGDSMQALIALEPEAKQALQILDMIPEGADLADWLRERLDLIEAARELAKRAPGAPLTPPSPQPRQPPMRPGKAPSMPSKAGAIPNYDFWIARLRSQSAPDRAASLTPAMGRGFSVEGVSTALIWLAEVESSMNPSARSPSGAKGLFQLMPDTAKGLGLSTWMPDERTHPEKSARAAARLLRSLHQRFGDWPLALAAYNAGEGRVRRSLEKQGGKTFADIVSSLPVETRLYVPKVLATVNTRTGIAPDQLPAPRR